VFCKPNSNTTVQLQQMPRVKVKTKPVSNSLELEMVELEEEEEKEEDVQHVVPQRREAAVNAVLGLDNGEQLGEIESGKQVHTNMLQIRWGLCGIK
jgi:hypothetical protein